MKYITIFWFSKEETYESLASDADQVSILIMFLWSEYN